VLVEIYSDVVCPWCYIGKRRFERALAEFEGRDDVEVVWRPYQLDPRAPAQPTPALDGYARKFGGPEQALRITSQMTEVGRAENLELDFTQAQRANTFDAHRLLWLAEREGDQDAVKEALLAAYFTEGRDVSDVDELVAIGAAAGLEAERVRSMLTSDEGRAEVQAELRTAVERGITAVPTFVFEGQWAVPGAQDPDTMLMVLRRVKERLGAAVTVPATDTCADDACDL
jgi:predicted DsbA family dithiol-disulfide isomerase